MGWILCFAVFCIHFRPPGGDASGVVPPEMAVVCGNRSLCSSPELVGGVV